MVEGERIGKRTRALSLATISEERYLHDNQGSVVVVLSKTGTLIQKLSYDAWSMRRNPDGTEVTSGSINAPTSRGYTDHEQPADQYERADV